MGGVEAWERNRVRASERERLGEGEMERGRYRGRVRDSERQREIGRKIEKTGRM